MTIPSERTTLASAQTRMADASSAPSDKARRTALEMIAPLGVPIMTLGMVVYFGFATTGFLSIGNITDVCANSALPVIVAVGLTIPLVMGEFDLSISALAGLATVLYAQLVAKEGVDPAIAILVTLAASLAAGAFNGFMIAYVGLPALVATIAMSSFLVGMQFYVSGSVQIYGGFPETLVAFSRSNIGPVPTLVIVAAIIVLGAWVLLEKSVFGRQVKAVGGNAEAARLAGVDVRRTRALGFILCTFAASIAGILFANKQAVAYPLAGLDVLLPSFTAAFIGAATFRFGEFNIFGTVVGVLVTQIAANGLILLGVPNYTTYVFQGVILLVALIFARVVALRGTN
ncbi:ribose transport system permease protein [Roseiarcus fermentans]|uniref:Ribose transport system permease protein n=1 Tax=Roseiarcus fermentans TaxID=1473586 RepID=A0A366FN84_9HYPH|nr:ABC transporter permease [Roseiarcus fermentans]RBP15586.1 ribose transport system permease protein [Roseiarcus fermentans]